MASMPHVPGFVDGWYWSRDEETWFYAGPSRDDAIEEGRESCEDVGFFVAKGGPCALYPELLNASYLGDIIDGANEEAGWEEGLTAEVTGSELKALTDDINRVWWEWAERIKLQSRVRGLNLSAREDIPPDPEFQEESDDD